MTKLTILGTQRSRMATAKPMSLAPLMATTIATTLKAVTAIKILATAAALLALCILAACGQRGNLVLPTEPAAQNRATLPQVLLPLPRSSASSPASGTAPASPLTPTGPKPAASAAL